LARLPHCTQTRADEPDEVVAPDEGTLDGGIGCVWVVLASAAGEACDGRGGAIVVGGGGGTA